MSSSFGSVAGHIKCVLDRAEAAGIAIEPTGSRFSEKLCAAIDVSPDNETLVRQIIGALERTLNRSHDDSRLVLSLCLSLQEYSSLPMPELLKKIERALKHLDKPAPAAVVRTIKTTTAAALHPKVIELHDLDAITALSKAPQNSISLVEGEKEILRVGSEKINLTTGSKKEIEAAVRKVKAEAKKSNASLRKNPAPDQRDSTDIATTEMENAELEQDALHDIEYEMEEEPGISEDLHSELDEAALVLSKLLISMPRKGRLSNLAQVIEQAKKLLDHTRRDLNFTRQQNGDDPVYGDLN